MQKTAKFNYKQLLRLTNVNGGKVTINAIGLNDEILLEGHVLYNWKVEEISEGMFEVKFEIRIIKEQDRYKERNTEYRKILYQIQRNYISEVIVKKEH